MKRLILAAALAASPALALGPGDGVEFTACGPAGRQGVVEAVRPATFGMLYTVRVLGGRAGELPRRIVVNDRCITAVSRPAAATAPPDAARPLPRVELAIDGRGWICAPVTGE